MPESREEMLRRKLHSPPELQLTAADILIADTPLGELKNLTFMLSAFFNLDLFRQRGY